jgi:hypothetical protein
MATFPASFSSPNQVFLSFSDIFGNESNRLTENLLWLYNSPGDLDGLFV